MAKLNATTALQTTVISDDDLTALLQGAGAIENSAPATLRMKVDGSSFIAGDQMFPYNAATKTPAFLGRLVGPLIEYQGFYFDQQHAQYANRPDIADRYCKSFFGIPEQARKYSETGASCTDCPFHPFTKDPPFGKKCQWRGELEVQIIPESGQLEGDEPIWKLDFSTTSVIEFKGTARNPQQGSVSPYNFMHLLAKLASEQAIANKEDPKTAVLKALVSYQNGGVVGEFRLLGASSDDNSRTWRVISVRPAAIFEVEAPTAIEAETPARPANRPEPDRPQPDPGAYDDLPF